MDQGEWESAGAMDRQAGRSRPAQADLTGASGSSSGTSKASVVVRQKRPLHEEEDSSSIISAGYFQQLLESKGSKRSTSLQTFQKQPSVGQAFLGHPVEGEEDRYYKGNVVLPVIDSNRPANFEQGRRILQGYLWGQLANVAKAALWWSTFGILVMTLFDHDIAIAATRGPFNLGLLLASPLAVATAERKRVRILLLSTTCGRLVVWSVLIPLAWVVVNNFLQMKWLFRELAVALICLDGVQVAFSNAVDIDCGGLDTLAAEHQIELTEFQRYKYSTWHQLGFDASFILLTPLVAFALFKIEDLFGNGLRWKWMAADAADTSSAFVLIVGVVLIFAVLSIASATLYAKRIPKHVAPDSATSGGDPQTPLWQAYGQKCRDVVDGCRMVYSEPRLKWRLYFLAMETSLEDAVVSVVIPIVALKGTNQFLKTNNKTIAAVAAVVPIAVGKLGGLLTGLFMASRWSPPTDSLRHSSYKKLFTFVLWSSMALVLLPWGFAALERKDNSIQVPLPPAPLRQMAAVGVAELGTSQLYDIYPAPDAFLPSDPAGLHNFVVGTDYPIAGNDAHSADAYFLAKNMSGLTTDPATSPTDSEDRTTAENYLAANAVVENVVAVQSNRTQVITPYFSMLEELVIDTARFIVNPPAIAGPIGILCGIFFFFVLSTAPKIGFASLTQNVIAQEADSGKVFGFVGCFVTAIDGLVIALINVIFVICGWNHVLTALWIIVALYLVCGFVEYHWGPKLVLPNSSSSLERHPIEVHTSRMMERSVSG